MSYVKVVNRKFSRIFNRIWMQCWAEKGYEPEFSLKVLAQFIFVCALGYGGALELKHLKDSDTIKGVKMSDDPKDKRVFNFLDFKHITNELNHVVEIDKLCILPEYRRMGILETILSLITQYAEENDVREYIALIEPKLGKALKRFYKIPVVELGEKFLYKGDWVVPVSIDPRQVYQNKEKFDWLNYQETKDTREKIII